MNMVIVPDSLTNAINAALDKAYLDVPAAAVERDDHFNVLLAYYDEHGVLPAFSLTKRDPELDPPSDTEYEVSRG